MQRILIVDDDLVVLKVLSFKLRAEGYQVLTAVDGSSAVNIVRREKPDLILLDIHFPPDVASGGGVPWDAFLILSWLGRMDEGKDIPVIIITAGDLRAYEQRCQQAGVVGAFAKPLDHAELLLAIRKVFKAKPEKEAPQAKPHKNNKILFVDDENDWRYMAAMYLSDAGYDVLSAGNSTEALSQAQQQSPDLIVLDLKLSGESGAALLERLKAKYPKVPVLLYTGFEHNEAEVQAMLRQGGHQYLRKGTMGELVQAVQKALAPQAPVVAVEETNYDLSEHQLALGPKTLLMVEDDVAFAETLQLFLESEGFQVIRAADGVEGLRQIRAIDVDIVLCDMAMPNMPGDQFYLAVRQAKPHLCRRFVFMTGHHADPKTDRFIRREHGFMLWKPFPLTDLLKAIEIIWNKLSTKPSRADSDTPALAAPPLVMASR